MSAPSVFINRRNVYIIIVPPYYILEYKGIILLGKKSKSQYNTYVISVMWKGLYRCVFTCIYHCIYTFVNAFTFAYIQTYICMCVCSYIFKCECIDIQKKVGSIHTKWWLLLGRGLDQHRRVKRGEQIMKEAIIFYSVFPLLFKMFIKRSKRGRCKIPQQNTSKQNPTAH